MRAAEVRQVDSGPDREPTGCERSAGGINARPAATIQGGTGGDPNRDQA
jgi:hypothetical protein